MLLGLQTLTGAMTRDERDHWRRLGRSPKGRISDPVRQAGDPWPAVAEVALELVHLAEHPRGYLRALKDPGPRPPRRPDEPGGPS